MRRLGQYISYIIAICSVVFCFSFASLSPWPVLPFRGSPAIHLLTGLSPITSPIASVAVAPIISASDLNQQLLKHVVKITNLATGSSGSGVILWAGLDNKKMGHTYILTNRHVLPIGTPGIVEIFNYLNFRNIESVRTFPVLSVVQNDAADLSLVEVLSNEVLANKATFIRSSDYEQMPLYTELFIVGCGLGNPPFISSGKVIGFGDKLMLNGFSVWGCSGGGVFDNQGRLVSITCQIGMATVGEHDYPITNISISIPVNIICDWLLTTNYKFIVNSELGSPDDIFKPKKYY